MTGYLDGCGDIILEAAATRARERPARGKISYLGGHQYSTTCR